MRVAGLLLFTYFAGSINFAIIALRLLGKEDPRTRFSGNAGTTNVYRQAGKGWAAVVLLLDVGRAAALAVLALAFLRAEWVPWVGLTLVTGNRFPLFHGFRGGKGVAGYLGFMCPLSPGGAVLACLVWVLVQRVVRLPFIASFFMVLILGGAAIYASGAQAIPVAGTAATVLLVVFNHRGNILSLKKGGQLPVFTGAVVSGKRDDKRNDNRGQGEQGSVEAVEKK
jgi:glycerol-3-phosphate acyltransferase PlsY